MLFSRSKPDGPRTGLRVIHVAVMLLIMLGLQTIGTLFVSIIELKSDPALEAEINAALSRGDQTKYNELITSCLLSGTLVAGLVALLPYAIRDLSKNDYCVAWISPWLIPALISTGVVLNAVAMVVVNMFPAEANGGAYTTELIAKGNPWIAVISIGIVTPIVEEMYFRRAIINSIKDRSAPIAAILSAVVFAMLHTGEVQIAYAFVFGLFFAVIYVKTGNLIYTMILHMSINTSSALTAVAGEEGDKYIIPVVTVCAAVMVASGLIIFIKKRRRA